jgi:hypothetical protein
MSVKKHVSACFFALFRARLEPIQNMKALKFALAGMVMAALILFFASPYWVLYQINQAYQQNDAAGIAKYIDFDQVKKSLQPQIEQKLSAAAGLEHLPGALQKWGHQLSSVISTQAVDAAVNEHTIFLLMQGKGLKESLQQSLTENSAAMPESIRNLLAQQASAASQSEKIEQDLAKPEMDAQGTAEQSSLDAQEKRPKPKMKAHYTGLNSFEIAVPNDAGEITHVEMRRSNLSWKIVNIQLPN